MFATLREITARKSLMPACNLRLEEYGCRITKMKIDPDGIRAWLKFDGLSGALGVRTTDISLSDDAGHISFGQFDTTVPLATKILRTAFRDPIPVNPEYAPVLRFGKNRTFGNFLSELGLSIRCMRASSIILILTLLGLAAAAGWYIWRYHI